MFNVGRICVKIAGRDAGKTCVVIKKIDDLYVIVDGETRRRKCNTKHLEILDKTLDIAEGASEVEVAKLFKSELGIELKQSKSKNAKERAKKQHAKKEKPVKEKKSAKKKAAVKKSGPKIEAKVDKEFKEVKEEPKPLSPTKTIVSKEE